MLEDLFAGPFNTKDEATDHANSTWGTISGNVIVELDGQFWINDGVDAETGKEFAVELLRSSLPGSISILA